MKQVIALKKSTKAAGDFVTQLKENAVRNDVFDSAASNEFISGAVNQHIAHIPENMQVLFDEVGADNSSKITKAILDGCSLYESANGCPAPADLIEQAFHLAYGTTDNARKITGTMDSATSLHADNLSLQPNRAVVAILSALSEGIPFVHYLPADIGSNEAKLAIISHLAGSNYGLYLQNALMDGAISGDPYITSSRVHATTNSTGAHTGQLTSQQATAETCSAVGGTVVAVNLLRGRTNVYVNGLLAATEVSSSGSGASTVAGSITIAGTSYVIGGTVNTDTGAIALTSTPALANGVPVHVEGFIDYERQPSITPSIVTSAETFKLFAKPWRVVTQQTPDSRSQMANELGVDPYQEALLNIQWQAANERHYELLWKAKRASVNNTVTFDFAWATMGAQKNRAQVWQDFSATLGAVSQQMAIDTLGFGISHMYIGNYAKAQFLGLSRDVFEPSGIPERAGVFRVGKLFGRYDVYYTPKVLTDSGSASQVLCIGRAADVARNPFVMGDAAPATIMPLGVGTDLKQGAGFYGRGFNEINPYLPSSKGCAMISITNMGL